MGGTQGTRVQRRLAAILAGDLVGFSALMGQDEEGTLARVKQLRRDLIEPTVQEHGGRVFKTTGDGFLAEFPSPVEAVRCALEVQEALAADPAQEPFGALQLRIGINLGDIIVEEDGDVYGEGVTSRPAWSNSPTLAVSGSPAPFTTTSMDGSKLFSRAAGSSRSRISPSRCACMRLAVRIRLPVQSSRRCPRCPTDHPSQSCHSRT